jgi:hypothetical protein
MDIMLISVAVIAAVSLISLVILFTKFKNAKDYADQADERVLDLEAMVSVLQDEVSNRISYNTKPVTRSKPKKKASKMKATVETAPVKKRGRKPKS